MAFNDKKIIDVLIGEVKKVPSRCHDYQKELADLLGDVLHFEREHLINRTNVVKRIADQVNTVGMWLYKSRPASAQKKEEQQ